MADPYATIPNRQLPRAGGPPSRRANTGLINAFAQTPDNAAFNWGPGGFIVEMKVWMKSWKPGFTHWFTSQGETTFGLDLAFTFSLHQNRRFRTAITANGTTLVGPECTEDVPFTEDSVHWIRTTVLPDFAGVSTFQYYWCPSEDGRTWVQLGATLTDVAVTMFNSTSDLLVPGFVSDSSQQITYEARYYTSFFFGGTMVANPRFDTLNPRTPSFTDDKGRTWTMTGDGLIAVT